MKNKISTLYITGDSFSQITPNDVNDQAWPIQLARIIDSNLKNASCMGVSQDWNWSILDQWSDEITPDDQLIVLLTDPGRFWFIEDKPELSNSWIVDDEYEKAIGNPEVKKAIEYYVQYIQRPKLDCIFLSHRLGWLNNMVQNKGWRSPLIILAFEQYIPKPENYSALTFARGNLFDISLAEKNEKDPIEYAFMDTRYNHLTLSNHSILTTKIANFLETSNPIDLSSGFNTGTYTNTSINNPEFTKKELSSINLEKYISIKATQSASQKSIMSRFMSSKRT